MFGFKRNKVVKADASSASSSEKKGIFKRLKSGLSRTRAQLTDGLARIVLGKKTIDEDVLEAIETQLLVADVGAKATQSIIQDLSARVKRKQLADSEALFAALQDDLHAILQPCEAPLAIDAAHTPHIILFVGVNGTGKTTTIGKLAKHLQAQGKRVMLAAGDTFRAAAVEQLQVWGERNQITVVGNPSGTDSASVIYDAVASAQAKQIDVLIADTAGRLHTQSNLMGELQKIIRVIKKLDPTAPHEIMLVLDAGTGQNALQQAKQFHDNVKVTGITLTKLDGTAKGGIIFAIAKALQLPIRFIGLGEHIDDLRPFNAKAFVEALLARESSAPEESSQEESSQ